MAESIIDNRDFILFGLQPWDIEIGSNFKNMAMELAKHNRVLYVNYPADRISIIRRRREARIKNRLETIRTGKNELTEVQENLFVLNPRVIVESINWIPFKNLYNRLNYRNSVLLGKEINKSVRKLGLKDPYLMIDNDFLRGFYLPELVDHEQFIFYIRDFLLSQPYFKKHGDLLEKKMIEKSDATVCNSAYLASYAKQFNSRSYDIGQGCDVKTFYPSNNMQSSVTHELKGIVIGYCGALLSTRLDINLIANVARQNPDLQFVFVGPEDEVFRNSVLHQIKNIHFIGPKPFQELPAYVHRFDVCINPQLVNEMTLGNYPRKIDEYLAAGKPVVATDTPAMEPFRPYVYLSKNAEEFSVKIKEALSEDKNQKLEDERIGFALSHTWEASVGKIYQVIAEGSINNKKKELLYDQ